MTRQTSIEVYRRIESEGLLSRLRLEVYSIVFEHGPLTASEAIQLSREPSKLYRSIVPRFAELKDLGVIQEIGLRPCRVTGREVLLWDVTNKLPEKKKKELKRSRQELEKRVQELERILNEQCSCLARLFLTKPGLDNKDA